MAPMPSGPDEGGVSPQPDGVRPEASATGSPTSIGPVPDEDRTGMGDAAGSAGIEDKAEADFLDVASAPSRSAAIVYGAMANALGLAMLNDVAAQQQASISRQQAVTMACAGILSLCFASDDGPPGDGAPKPQPAADAETPNANETSRVPPAPAVAQTPDAEAPAAARPAAAAAETTAASNAEPPWEIPPELVDAINQMQTATLSHQVVLTCGAGKAYQLVAQSAALTIMDAGDLMRAAATLAVFVKTMALTKYAITGEEKYARAAAAGQAMLAEAVADYSEMCAAAAEAVQEFPAG